MQELYVCRSYSPLVLCCTDFDVPVDVSNCNFSISFQMPEMLFLVFREVHEVFEQKCIYSGKYYNREEHSHYWMNDSHILIVCIDIEWSNKYIETNLIWVFYCRLLCMVKTSVHQPKMLSSLYYGILSGILYILVLDLNIHFDTSVIVVCSLLYWWFIWFQSGGTGQDHRLCPVSQ